MEPRNRADFENHYGGPEDEAPDNSIRGDQEVELKLVYSDGTFKDQSTGKPVPITLDENAKSVIGWSNDTYTLYARIIVHGSLVPRRMGSEDFEVDENEVDLEVHGCHLQNDRSEQGFEVRDPYSLFHLYNFDNKQNAPYKILWDQDGQELSISVRAA